MEAIVAQLASDSEELHQVRDRVLGTAFQGVPDRQRPLPRGVVGWRGGPVPLCSLTLAGGFGGPRP